jgi:hypothetical protein
MEGCHVLSFFLRARILLSLDDELASGAGEVQLKKSSRSIAACVTPDILAKITTIVVIMSRLYGVGLNKWLTRQQPGSGL